MPERKIYRFKIDPTCYGRPFAVKQESRRF